MIFRKVKEYSDECTIRFLKICAFSQFACLFFVKDAHFFRASSKLRENQSDKRQHYIIIITHIAQKSKRTAIFFMYIL